MTRTFAHWATTCLLVAFLFMSTGCGTGPSTYAFPRRKIDVSPEQVRSLAVLVPTATRSAVVAILGEPTYEIRKPTQAEVARVTGSKPLRLSAGAQAMEMKEQVILSYMPDGAFPSSEVRFLMVFLTDGKYSGYVWRGSPSVLPVQTLNLARPFVESPCDKRRLMEVLGTPSSMGQHPDGGFLYRFAFDAPAEVKALDLPMIELMWIARGEGTCVFHGLSPDFIWRYDGMSSASAGKMASMQQAESDFYTLMQTQKTGPKAIRSGPEYEHVLSVLNRLLKQCFNAPDPIELCLMDDPEVNASAGNGCDGAIITVNLGLLKCLPKDRDDELAHILGHELGHLMDHHTDVPLKRIQSLARDPQIFKWSRCWEHAADIRGLDLMARAGYDPQAVVKCIKLTTQDKPSTRTAFATHPLGEMRIRMVQWYMGFRGVGGPKK